MILMPIILMDDQRSSYNHWKATNAAEMIYLKAHWKDWKKGELLI